MKLLQKTNRTYLILSASAFTIAGLLTYFILSLFFESQLNEKLSDSKVHLIKTIERSGIIYTDPPYIEVREEPVVSEIKDFYSDTVLFDTTEKESVPFRQLTGTSLINGKNYKIIIRNTLIEKSDFLLTIILTTGSVFLLLLLSLYFINKKLSRKIWSPFYSFLDELKKFSQENTSFALTISSGIEEFEELKLTLNKLTTKVISDYQVLKRFTEDASHEIQTPLSIIQSRLESLIQAPDLTEMQATQIHSAYSASARLAKLTRSMLFLARIENRQYPESEKINLESIVRSQTEFFAEAIRDKSISVEIHSESECILNANVFLAESLVQNLLGNAIKHSFRNSRIIIKISQESFVISNNGAPLLVEPEKLFDRFYKVNSSSDSFGLGLSIAREICKAYNWNIIYITKETLHTVIIKF
jgi:two-component system, OmpR family, sensor kinase